MAKPRNLLETLAPPAPPRAGLLYEDKLENAGVPMYGAYADTDQMVVHALKGQPLSKVGAGHELGHLFTAQILTAGDRNYFSRMLGTDPGYWNNTAGANPGGRVAGDEAFADYYAAAAAGVNLKTGGYTGYVAVDPRTFRKFTAALTRVGARRGLSPLDLRAFLASGR